MINELTDSYSLAAPVVALADCASDRNLNLAGAALITSVFSVPLVERDQAEYHALPKPCRERIQNLFTIFELLDAAPHNRRAVARAQSRAFGGMRGYSTSTILDLYYKYRDTADWHILINRSQAKDHSDAAQPAEFITFWQELCQSHKRVIRSAMRELYQLWRTGKDENGRKASVPGYGTWQQWWTRTHPGEPLPIEAPLPPGWGRSQLYRLKPGKAVRAIGVQGTAAALAHLPHNLTDRSNVRFLQTVTFDDVKTDWRVLDDRTGTVCDLWLLVAIDRATGLILGFWMRPALAREDGTQQHLTLRDMKQLVGWVLWTWGLPPYAITYKLERGTATIAQATAAAIAQLFGGRIKISYTGMIGGNGASGYKQRAVGNARGKAGHESTNNLLHNVCDNLPGQTGPRYDKRPADLIAREKHALDIWQNCTAELPPQLRDQVQYPVYTLTQARAKLNERINWMNHRTEHDLQGYESFWEWRETSQHPWQPMLGTLPPGVQPDKENKRKRKHSPVERARILRQQVTGDWTAGEELAPLLVRVYDTHREIAVLPSGEVMFKAGDEKLYFRPPAGMLTPGAKLLAWYNEQQPRALHLTNLLPHGGYVCTAILRERVGDGDLAALEESMRYTQAARAAAEAEARRLAAPEAACIAAIDEHNARLLAEHNANRFAIDADAAAARELLNTDEDF
jgi:hypothetical protein